MSDMAVNRNYETSLVIDICESFVSSYTVESDEANKKNLEQTWKVKAGWFNCTSRC